MPDSRDGTMSAIRMHFFQAQYLIYCQQIGMQDFRFHLQNLL